MSTFLAIESCLNNADEAKQKIDSVYIQVPNSSDSLEDSNTKCKNGKDDDGDGLTDCKDSECAFTLACPSQIENTAKLCDDGWDNDSMSGADCADFKCAPFPNCRENTKATCSDKIDNDLDSLADCKDSDCASELGCLNEILLDQCQNGKDDDGDSLIDCADSGCAAFSICTIKPVENMFYLCMDSVDNDKDGITDCQDNDCAKTEGCLPEVACTDSHDNDLDGKTDCDDLDCKTNPTCIPESACTDESDNDYDGKVDCADTDCTHTLACIGTCGSAAMAKTAKTTCLPAPQNFITVINKCQFPLWNHILGSGYLINEGKSTIIEPNKSIRFSNIMGGGRVYAYFKDPQGVAKQFAPINDYNAFVEFIFDGEARYSISFVDYISLPVAVRGDGSNCSEQKCSAPMIEWNKALKELCPHELDHQHKTTYTDSMTNNTWTTDLGVCTGSYMWCMEGNPIRDTYDPYCTKMEQAYSGKYPEHPEWKFTGAQLYGGVTPNMPKGLLNDSAWNQVAAWNRGSDPGETRPWLHYREDRKPYNDYAKMIHKDLGCKAYAFSTDDRQDQGGWAHCADTKSFTITWCPDN